ncbi:MAG TPA: hypothetical protein VNF29_01600 [Candidatus Binataceae bacterium]|nr:hypothetical protein [Candidatus Binataceae bacterium]
MWTQFTIDGKPVLCNMAIVSHVTERADGQRGCQLFTSAAEFVVVDQGLREVMTRLGLEPRS